ncbi:MAG: hypothetical protein U5L09_06545 [Bacteroidales bacterium]|nr:hypothetical protein [Bacteroidales bacterium]
MIYKAYSSFTEILLNQPETGMGYQLIEAKRPNQYYSQQFIVYNAELIVDLNGSFQENRRKILNEGHDRMFSLAHYADFSLSKVFNSRELRSFRELRSVRMFSDSKMEEKGRHSGGTGAIDNAPIYANGEDIFVRLSAYENDRRIDFENKCLLDGTFTTTEEDYLSCKSHNDNPVDRYALPNDEEIKWAFYVQPKSYDKYRPGIVQPANGHNGGGVEALFDNGTSKNTYLKKTSY